MKSVEVKRFAKVAVLVMVANLTACTTVSNWFKDDEEIEIRTLDPITPQFQPEIVWENEVGDGVDQYFSRLEPAIAYDKVFAASRQGEIKAFDQATGKVVWERDFAEYNRSGFIGSMVNMWSSGTSAKIAGGMSVAYETVYFGSEDGVVYALDANTGDPKWQTSIPGEVLAPPALDEGIALVNTGAGILFALDAETGEELWRQESEVPPLSLRGISAPAAANGGAIVGTPDGKISVSIMETGQTAWEQTIAAPTGATELERIVDIDSSPIVFGGTIFTVSFNGTLAAIDLRSGRVLWKREYGSYRNVTLSGNSLFVVDNNSNVYALDRRNGVELWSHGSLRKRSLTAATPVGDYVVAGDNWGFLHWFSQADGTIVARMDIGGDDEDEAIYIAPVASGDMLYIQTRDGQILAIRTP